MSKSLRDQLLNAGLVTKKKVNQIDKQKQKKQRLERKGQLKIDNEQSNSIAKKIEEKQKKDIELNKKQLEKKEKKALQSEIKQLIEKSMLPKLDNEDYYNFVDGKKIKRISVNGVVREKLSKGSLAIVSYAGYYAIIPADIAIKIQRRDEKRVIYFNAKFNESNTEDDPYKDYIIPDDLMW